MDNYMKTIVSGIKTWASSIKSDWNENDPSADGYIRNRPFWTSDPVEKVLLGETSVEIAEDGGNVQISNTLMFDIGTTYYVTFNGVEYECVAYDMWNTPVVGNGTIAGGSGGNGEPFLVVGGYNLIYSSEAGDYTVGISQMENGEVHKIDKKYLPDLSNVGKAGSGKGSEIFNDYARNSASGEYSHAEGYETTASGHSSHSEGYYTNATGKYSHSEGVETKASGKASHAEGRVAKATGNFSHAEGNITIASGVAAHAEGESTIATGDFSHVEGNNTGATGNFSHSEGVGTIASGEAQHVQGKFNIEDIDNKYAHIVGNGKSESSGVKRSNAHTLDWSGTAWYAGTVYIGGDSQDDADEVATKQDFSKTRDYLALTDVVNGNVYIVEMRDGNLVSRSIVASIKVTTPPNKTEYIAGERFDSTGMVVTATCQDGSQVNVTSYECDIIVKSSNVMISYEEVGNTHTTTLQVDVTPYDAEAALIDFEYTANNDDTYTITGWKGTLNGEPSTEMIIPDNGLIKL